ncbi:hypothetical protein NHH03_19515 [Stieleria sp. TO1_6]|uniref:esterase/lipase family protein n=1 Tax=Stieleria tagensis TaxID=2956795 RepID=UPI00209B8550|nr:hypothetical protein [Stieleria tagensis]MCO8123942.1 hypothetical protein [Stieleria tagensis]
MDARFFEMARAATAGSSQIRAISDLADGSRVRGATESRPSEFSPIVRLQLTDDEGVLEWEETAGSVLELGDYRSSGAVRTGGSLDAIEMEFERLPPSKITRFLSRRDDKLTPQRGLRRFDFQTRSLLPSDFPEDGHALVFVHGTFSNSENMIAGLSTTDHGVEFLQRADRRYAGNVFTFDHPTLAVGPILNAMDFQRLIAGSRAKIDLVGHSRGGLVTRWWCETFDPFADRCDKAVFVGSPLSGTGLAAGPNIRDSIHLLTQVSKALQTVAGLTAIAIPVFSVVEVLLRVLTSITGLAARTPVADAAMAMIPGLFAMSRVGNNPELRRLLESSAPAGDRYYAIRSNFQPSDPGWKFWQRFRKDRIVDAAAGVLFDGANDLVVDTPSMIDLSDEIKISAPRLCDFGDSETVHHLNYFYQPQTAAFLGDTLLSV